MKLPPVALCALLALAGHCLLLWGGPGRPAGADGSAAPAAHLTLVQLPADQAAPAPAPPADAAEAPPPQPAEAAEPAETAASATSDADATPAPPEVVAPPAEIGFPDAVLPDGGVQLRAFVRVDADGAVQAVATAAAPADAPAPFRSLGEWALAAARFQPAPAPRSYCLQLDFIAGAAEPAWGWLPERSAEGCLRKPAAAVRVTPLARPAGSSADAAPAPPAD